MIHIDIINESTVLSDSQVQAVIPALQQQVTNDYYPIWGTNATLAFISKTATPDPTHWIMSILDNTDQAGALGYHDITASGQPLAKVFAGSDLQYNVSWSVDMSHELLEMLTDPYIDYTVLVMDNQGNITNYALECCDSPESDSFAYKINDVLVSDFVTPAWFESFEHPAGTQYDFKNHITASFQLLSGGYIGVLKASTGSGWTQQTAEKMPTNTRYRGHIGSRRERRSVPKYQWVRSTK